MSDISEKATKMSKENDLNEEINQAYIDNVGEDYATASDVAEAYHGEYKNDKEFAQEMAENLGSIQKEPVWPYTCIDWEHAASELMMDYFEMDGYYFRNL